MDPHHVHLFTCPAWTRALQRPHLLLLGPYRAGRTRQRAVPHSLSRKCVCLPSRLSKHDELDPPVSFETLAGGAFSSLFSLAWNKRNHHSHGASGTHRFPPLPTQSKSSKPHANIRMSHRVRRDIRPRILLRLCRATCTVPSLLRGAHARMGLHQRHCML